jgi:hypothetical protein
MTSSRIHLLIHSSSYLSVGLALVLCLLLRSTAWAQPAQDDHVALVMRIVDSKTGQPIPNLKVYLVDENRVPYTVKNAHWDDDLKRFSYSYDSLVFYDNAHIRHPRGKHLEPYPRHAFAGFETSYVIEIPPHDIQRTSPSQIPVYMAKVVDIDGEKNGGQFPTRIYRLDYRNAVPLHQKGCYEAPQRGSYVFALQTVTGNRFEPTTYYLDQPALPNPAFDPLFHMYRANIDTLLATNGLDSLYGLRSIVIRNWYSLLKIKEIEPSNTMYLGSEGIKKVLEIGDYLDPNPTGIMDVRIWVKRIKNDLDQFEDYYDFYCYNRDSESYDRIPLLSDYPNIEIQAITEPIRRKSAGLENGRIYERYFILKDMQWAMINEIFHISNPTSNPSEPLSACVQWLDDRSHLAKVYFHSNAESNVEVSHRFKYLNACRAVYQPLPFRSSHDPYFSASKFVASGDTGWVQFSATLAASMTGLQPTAHMAYVPTTDNPHHSVDIEFFVAHIEWVTQWHANGTPAFVMVQRSDGLANALVIDEEGYPVESGTYYPNDQQKIGTWQRYNRKGAKSHITYGRIVHANIAWPIDIKDEVVVLVYRNGSWQQHEAPEVHGDRKIYLYEKIDSIRVQAGHGVFKQPIHFDQLANENWLHIQLIYPEQIPLPMANSAVGIEILPDTYGIEWDHVFISTNFDAGTKSTIDLTQLLQIRHPQIELTPGYCDYCTIISLAHLSSYQRVQVMNQLLRDSMILHLNQVFRMNRGAVTYFHGDASMRVNYNLSYPKVQAKLESYGFVYRDQVYGAAGLYSVNWPHKLRGLEFIQALQKAAKDSDISHVSPSLYFEPRVESW